MARRLQHGFAMRVEAARGLSSEPPGHVALGGSTSAAVYELPAWAWERRPPVAWLQHSYRCQPSAGRSDRRKPQKKPRSCACSSAEYPGASPPGHVPRVPAVRRQPRAVHRFYHSVTFTSPLVLRFGQPNCSHHFTLTREKNAVQSCCRSDPGCTGTTSILYAFFTRCLETRLY